MNQEGKKLSNVEYQDVYNKIFDLFWMNDVSKNDTHICSRPLFKTSELIIVNKVIGDHVELEVFSNYFFEEFSNCVKKNNRLIWLRRIEYGLVRFGNYNCCWSFEMRQPISQIYTSVNNINKFEDYQYSDIISYLLKLAWHLLWQITALPNMSFDYVMEITCILTITILYKYFYVWELDFKLNNISFHQLSIIIFHYY